MSVIFILVLDIYITCMPWRPGDLRQPLLMHASAGSKCTNGTYQCDFFDVKLEIQDFTIVAQYIAIYTLLRK